MDNKESEGSRYCLRSQAKKAKLEELELTTETTDLRVYETEEEKLLVSTFGIDLIREEICSKLEYDDLKSLRLVCRRWAVWGAKELQKRSKILIYYLRKLYTGKDAKFSLQQLTELMTSSLEFPTNHFAFCGPCEYTMDPVAPRFFRQVGSHIKRLALGFPWFSQFCPYYKYYNCKKIQILFQLPNLQVLELYGRFDIDLRNSTLRLNAFDLDSDKTGLFSCMKVDYNSSVKMPSLVDPQLPEHVFPKLKSLRIFDEVPSIFFNWIVECSPFLQSIELSSDVLPFLLYPLNRLHLLKNLVIDFADRCWGPLEIFANEIHKGGNKFSQFSPKQLTVRVSYCRESVDTQETLILNKILDACSKSVETLVWDVTSELFPTLQMPKEMPKVSKIVFRHSNFELDSGPQKYFPEGMSLSLTFPNLKYVDFNVGVKDHTDLYIGPLTFLSNDNKPVTSVNFVTFEGKYISEREIDIKYFRKKLFPNAHCHIKTSHWYQWKKKDDFPKCIYFD